MRIHGATVLLNGSLRVGSVCPPEHRWRTHRQVTPSLETTLRLEVDEPLLLPEPASLRHICATHGARAAPNKRKYYKITVLSGYSGHPSTRPSIF